MSKILFLSLRVLRKFYSKIFKNQDIQPSRESDPDIASQLIYESILSEKPVMIARFGSTELINIVNYLGVSDKKYKNFITFIKGETPAWWWQENVMKQLQVWSGFFPPTKEKIEKFCELMLEDRKLVDILGSWLADEKFVDDVMQARKVHLFLLEPFWSKTPWTRALEGKNVLVVHPFSKTILSQYENREYLFENKDVLPKFKSLSVIKAVQSLEKEDDKFKDWFEALEYMKSEIDKVDYDICLIGAGAYGFPLAAHVKRQGKKSIHLGGALQLMFGIRGTRWENPEYGVNSGIPKGFYSDMMNEYWVRPNENETPRKANQVEGACYW